MEYTMEDIWWIEELKRLEIKDILYHKRLKNSDGTPQRWRVNGKVQTWRRDNQRIRIPIKRGLYEYGYVDEHNFRGFSLREVDAR